MILLDANALIALLADEPAASEVADLISNEQTAVAVPNLAEAADRMDRVYGVPLPDTRSAIEALEQSSDLHVRAAERAHAWRAAYLRSKHYHRKDRRLSLGDCLLLAMTGEQDQLATADPDVLDTAADESIGWIALPDSTGRRHAP